MKNFYTLAIFLIAFSINAQENIKYQKPSKEILDLVEFERPPSVQYDDDKNYMVFLYRDNYKSISDLSEKELRLGGLRINPKTNIGSRVTFYNNVKIKKLKSKNESVEQVSGLPDNPKLTNFAWSPDETKIALTNTTDKGVELWVLDLETASVVKLTEPILNANIGGVITWQADSQSMLVKTLSKNRKPLIDTNSTVPDGPTISNNYGAKAQNRTYQDLLKNKSDEHNFEQLATSSIHKVSLNGSKEKWLDDAMYRTISFSPDGNYVMVSQIKKPFSYLVTYGRFPSQTDVFDKQGKLITNLLDTPLIEELPKGRMSTRTGKRSYSWRADKPSTLIYVKALDGGDPALEANYRDEVFEVEAPFSGEGKSLVKTTNRFSGIDWGTENTAIVYDYWWDTRNRKAYVFNPSNSTSKPKVLYDRNYQDIYSDPGSFLKTRNTFNKSVLMLYKGNAYLRGAGFSKEGQFPFIDKLNITTLNKSRVYQSKYTDKVEAIQDYNPSNNELIVRIESPTEYPNYYSKKTNGKKLSKITDFENPFKELQNVKKEVITYKRDDGLELSGILYLPVNYDEEKKEKAPMILWAYPREFKDRNSASQNSKNPNRFTSPYYGSMVYWVTKGYVVLDDASFPIIGEGEEEPNDSFRKQLVANGKAAIDAVDKMGYIDRTKVAVGGHSYGAFMVANLLSHSNLYAAGIARSGAYNRTLTPFGFQSEQRSYWEAPNVYYTMSPFMHAEKMKTPLLLIHGEDDNNSGTYPMQSERYFNALKGLGATVRLVMLPKESHGYASKESIYHVLWEQDQWLEKHVKNKQ
jgi:dipeptidyl aminopeptidase/acylaminoacyl peptidase